MARADDPAYGTGSRSSRGYDEAERRAEAGDPRRRPVQVESQRYDPRHDERVDPRQDGRYDGNPDPRRPATRGPAPLNDPRQSAVPPTRARPAINTAGDQSYAPQFERYEVPPQRTGTTVRRPAMGQSGDYEAPRGERRPASAAPPDRLDPALFGHGGAETGHYAPYADARAGEPRNGEPRNGDQRVTSQRAAMPTQPVGRGGASRQMPERAPYGADRYEPHLDAAYDDRRGVNGGGVPGYDPAVAPATAYTRSHAVGTTRSQPPQAQPQNWQGYDNPTVDPDAEETDPAYEDQEDEYELEDEDDAPPRSRRLVLAIAAIGVAVVLGAGIGLGYKFLTPEGAASDEPTLVQADASPAKKPGPAGETSKKSIYRVGQEDASGSTVVQRQESPISEASADDAAATDGTAAPPGPRKVSTVTIRPGDTIAADTGVVPVAAAAVADEAGASANEVEVPGISLVPAGPSAAGPVDAAAKPLKPKKLAAVAKPVATEVNASASVETVDAAAPLPEPIEPVAQPVQPAKKPKPKPVQVAAVNDATATESLGGPALNDNTDAAAAPAAKAPKPASGGGQGFVAQIRASKSRVDALGSFADIQQRYADLLGNAQPDIQEADLGAKGIWYRLRIGPPGSRKSAGDLCAQLKAKGMKECIVVAY